MDPLRPPPRWEWLLARSAAQEDRDPVVQDLRDLYRARVEQWGRVRAMRWYRSEVLNLIRAFQVERARGRIRWGWRAIREDGMGELWREIRQAVRSMGRSPGLAALAVLTLTLGIGANTVIFSVVDHVALRPLPYDQPERLVAIWPDYFMVKAEIDWIAREAETLEDVAGYFVTEGFNLELTDLSRRITGAEVMPSLLPALGVEPILGRAFAASEGDPGSDDVVMVSHALWQEQFAGDPAAVGRTVSLDGRSRTIIGVLPAGFSFPQADQDVLVPMVMSPADVGNFWGSGGMRSIARLRPGATPEAARDEILAMSGSMASANPLWTPDSDYRSEARVVRLQEAVVGDVQETLLILLGAVSLMLLVACGNVTNLLLARGLSRSRMVAVRSALGASRGRLVREHLVESLLLSAMGCVAALVAAGFLLDVLVDLLPADIPRREEITLDLRVIGVGVVLALLAGVVSGVVPALRGSGADPGSALREGGHRSVGGTRRRQMASAMVVGQMAVAVVLVVGAGLLLRSLGAMGSVDTGVRPDGVTVAQLTLAVGSYPDQESQRRFFDDVVERVHAAPGVEGAAVSTAIPFGGGMSGIATFIDGVTLDPNDLPVWSRRIVGPEFFDVLGIPSLEGRGFETTDVSGSPEVVIVDRTAAERYWPGESAVGKTIRYPWRGAPPMEVVGVVGGTIEQDLTAERTPTYYQPLSQVAAPTAFLLVRGAGMTAATAVRSAVREVDERVPVARLRSMTDLISSSLARARWTATLLTLFAGLTLLLGCVGVYGVVAYSVRRRTQEIGVRLALGAGRGRIRRAVLVDGLRLAILGTALGLAFAVPTARVLGSLLFRVSPFDPVTFVAVPLVLVAAGVVSVYVPAVRATRVDPVEALREEV